MNSSGPPDPIGAHPRPRPVGRGEKVRAAVLAAALVELDARGYAALTVDQIAQRAGVHKTTVYRRWGDLDALLVDALTEQIADDIPIPDTGSAAGDLRLLARGLAAWLTSTAGRAVLTAMLSDAVRVPGIAEARRRIFADRVRRAAPVVARAVARGELPPGTDPMAVIRALAAPLYFRALITAEPLDEAAADQAAADALVLARNRGQDGSPN